MSHLTFFLQFKFVCLNFLFVADLLTIHRNLAKKRKKNVFHLNGIFGSCSCHFPLSFCFALLTHSPSLSFSFYALWLRNNKNAWLAHCHFICNLFVFKMQLFILFLEYRSMPIYLFRCAQRHAYKLTESFQDFP